MGAGALYEVVTSYLSTRRSQSSASNRSCTITVLPWRDGEIGERQWSAVGHGAGREVDVIALTDVHHGEVRRQPLLLFRRGQKGPHRALGTPRRARGVDDGGRPFHRRLHVGFSRAAAGQDLVGGQLPGQGFAPEHHDMADPGDVLADMGEQVTKLVRHPQEDGFGVVDDPRRLVPLQAVVEGYRRRPRLAGGVLHAQDLD